MSGMNFKAAVIAWCIISILSFWGMISFGFPFWVWLILNVIITPIVLLIGAFDASVRDREMDRDPIGFQMKEELKRKNDLLEEQNKLLKK